VNESILTEGSSSSITLAQKGMKDFETTLAEISPLLAQDEPNVVQRKRFPNSGKG